MSFFRRLMFAVKYDFVGEFIVYSVPDQLAISFLEYEDAKKFSDEQIQYRPKVMIGVEKL